jgi:hypothetical protein
VVLLESLRSLLSKDIKFAPIGALSKELWLPEVGVSELFFYVFQAKILARPKMLLTNRELHVVVGVALFLKVLDFRINLQRVEKTQCAKRVPREEKCARFLTLFSYFRQFSRTQLT